MEVVAVAAIVSVALSAAIVGVALVMRKLSDEAIAALGELSGHALEEQALATRASRNEISSLLNRIMESPAEYLRESHRMDSEEASERGEEPPGTPRGRKIYSGEASEDTSGEIRDQLADRGVQLAATAD